MSTKALAFTDTTIGKKIVMAVSGIVLFGFLVVHMIGNLQYFIGPEALNKYAHALQSMKPLLWGFRCVLLLALVAHFATAIQLTKLNRQARPTGYAKKKNIATSYAALTMPLGGLVLLAYIVYHIGHLTLGMSDGLGYDAARTFALNAGTDAAINVPDVHYYMMASFRKEWLLAVYVVAQIALGLHVYHGAWSLFQSLGINHKRYNAMLRSAASAIALAVVSGFLAVPIAVYLALVPK